MEDALPEISEGNATLNADLIKEALPEFLPGVEGSDENVASLVHGESSYLAKAIMAEALARKVSITLDGTGDGKATKVKAQIARARQEGYVVNGYYVTAETDESVRRANVRAQKTGRAVPEDVIRDTHIAVSDIFEEIVGDFDSMVLYDTQTDDPSGATNPKDGKPLPALIGRKEAGGDFTVGDDALYTKFTDKRNEFGAPPKVTSTWTPYEDMDGTSAPGEIGTEDTPSPASALSQPAGPLNPASVTPASDTATFGREDGVDYVGDPVDDDVAYRQHATYITETIDKALADGLATDRQFTVNGDGQTWTDERAALHKEILDDLYANAQGVPNEGKAVMAGGLGGAGKGTVLRDQAGINQSLYLTVNPDDIKELMAERGMVPEVEGLSPMEANTLAHEEASYLALQLANRAYADRKNIIWDITMSSQSSAEKRIVAMRDAGYDDVQAIFVDIPVETSVERALARHRNGMARHRNGEGYGGRFVPPAVIRANENADWSSANRSVFETTKGDFDGFRVYDNSRAGEEATLIEEGGTANTETPPAFAADETSPASMSTADIEAAIAAGNAAGSYLAALKRELATR
jgi:predicted ABC-type ATPase